MMSSGVLCPLILLVPVLGAPSPDPEDLHTLVDADAAEEGGGVAQAAGDYGGSSIDTNKT